MSTTALKCLQHLDRNCREVLAVGSPERGVIEVHDRRHGTVHAVELTLTQVVSMLDPNGTTYRAVEE